MGLRGGLDAQISVLQHFKHIKTGIFIYLELLIQ